MVSTRARPRGATSARRHRWHGNRCSACGLERRRQRGPGFVEHWFYFRDGRAATGRGLPCPGGPAADLLITRLEAQVLARLSRRHDPWEGLRISVGSRTVSQAIGRLGRKGLLQEDFSVLGFSITPNGERALALAFEYALRGWL